jgi:hypothetical protein
LTLASALANTNPMTNTATTITPTAAEKAEWSRLAQAAYKGGQNAVGHRFSMAAALPNAAALPVARYDALQAAYRSWLLTGQLGEVAR